MPPDPLMPYIEKLKMQLEFQYYRPFPSLDLLTPFHTAPITCLGIAGGVLTTGARVCLVECVIALSATLQTAVLKSCSPSLHLILDIALTHLGLKRLHLLYCHFKSTKPGLRPPPRRVFARSGTLCFSRPVLGVHHLAVAAVARPPNQFGRLDLDHVHSQGAQSRSHLFKYTLSLVHRGSSNRKMIPLIAIKPWPGRVFQPIRTKFGHEEHQVMNCNSLHQHPFHPRSNASQWPGVDQLENEACLPVDPRRASDRTRPNVRLDSNLFGLANVATKRGGKGVTFVPVSTGGQMEECISFRGKWLPELLPRFRGVGSLSLDFGRRRPEAVPNHDRILLHPQRKMITRPNSWWFVLSGRLCVIPQFLALLQLHGGYPHHSTRPIFLRPPLPPPYPF